MSQVTGSEGFESDDRPGRIERLGELLREVRRRLEDYQELADPTPAQRDAWDADLYFYDDALVSVADLLDIDVPPAWRDDLTPEGRTEIEAAVTAAGLDLSTVPPD